LNINNKKEQRAKSKEQGAKS